MPSVGLRDLTACTQTWSRGRRTQRVGRRDGSMHYSRHIVARLRWHQNCITRVHCLDRVWRMFRCHNPRLVPLSEPFLSRGAFLFHVVDSPRTDGSQSRHLYIAGTANRGTLDLFGPECVREKQLRSSISWKNTRSRLRADRERLKAHFSEHGVPVPTFLILHSSYQCVFLFRLSAYSFRRGWLRAAKSIWYLNLLVTGADIEPSSDLGPGLVILHPISVQIFGSIGTDCVFWGYGGIGGGRSSADIGAGVGLPVIGNRVIFGPRALAIGPVKIGDDCRIGAGCLVLTDLAADTLVEAPRYLQRTS
jgi:serine O-acetyltransferase